MSQKSYACPPEDGLLEIEFGIPPVSLQASSEKKKKFRNVFQKWMPKVDFLFVPEDVVGSSRGFFIFIVFIVALLLDPLIGICLISVILTSDMLFGLQQKKRNFVPLVITLCSPMVYYFRFFLLSETEVRISN